MTELFGRAWSLTIGTMDVSAFDIKFRVEKTFDPLPNKAVVEVYNLSEEHRGQLAQLAPGKTSIAKKKGKAAPPILGQIPTRLEAGYGKDTALIFLGDLRTVDTEKNEGDWITTLTTGDAEKAYKSSRVNISIGPKTSLKQAMAAVLKTFGLGTGNLNKVVQQLQGGSSTLPRGAVLSGASAKVLTDLCRSADIEWSFQDSVPTFVNLGMALDGRATKITADTGMVGSPTVDANGIMKVKTLIIPNLRCGGLVVVDSEQVKGNYRVQKLTYSGSSFDQEWYCEIEANRY